MKYYLVQFTYDNYHQGMTRTEVISVLVEAIDPGTAYTAIRLEYNGARDFKNLTIHGSTLVYHPIVDNSNNSWK